MKRIFHIIPVSYLAAGTVLLALMAISQSLSAAQLRQASGKISFLRVHSLGSKWGPPQDQIDVEVVVKLKSQPDKAFGFQLRDDTHGPARRAMLDLIRDAFRNDWAITIDYWINPGKKNGLVERVWVTK